MAQHYQFSQFLAAQTYLNPAFTGANVCSRLSFSYRDQWPYIPGTFVTTQLSYDHYVREINSGLGILLFNDKAGSGKLRSTDVNLLYAHGVQITKEMVFRAGIAFGFVQRSINFYDLTFADQLARLNAPSTLEIPAFNKYYFDASSGLLMYSKKNWVGISLHHVTSPDQSLVELRSSLPMEFRFHGGKRFIMKNQSVSRTAAEKEKNNYAFAFNYKHQNKFDQLDIGAYLNKYPLVFGIWYRGLPIIKAYKKGYGNNDALVFILGVSTDRFNIGYSYDYTISKLQIGSSIGSHEITSSYQFCNPNATRKRKPITVICPKF